MAKWIKVNGNSSDYQNQGAYVNLDQVDAIAVVQVNNNFYVNFHVTGKDLTSGTSFYNSATAFVTAQAAHDAVAKLLGKSDLPSL